MDKACERNGLSGRACSSRADEERVSFGVST